MHRLVQFVDSYDPPIKGLHEDLNFVSPRIGEVMLMSFSIAVVITVKGSIVISPSLGFGVILLYSIYSPKGLFLNTLIVHSLLSSNRNMLSEL